jgi:hypothetical protein
LVVAVNVGHSAPPPVARYRSGRGRQTTTAAPFVSGATARTYINRPSHPLLRTVG